MTVVLNVLVYAFLDAILRFLQIPQELYGQMREYLVIIFAGLLATFLYNFFACLLRAAGNSVAPPAGLSAGLNIALDLLFVLRLLGHCRRGGGDGLFGSTSRGSPDGPYRRCAAAGCCRISGRCGLTGRCWRTFSTCRCSRARSSRL